MIDAKQVNGAGPAIDPKAAQRLVKVMTNAVGAQAALMLALGVALPDVVNILVDVACQLVANVEPAQLRTSVTVDMSRNIRSIVEKHVVAKNTTAGGVIIAKG